MPAFKNITGLRFGRLVAVEPRDRDPWGSVRWLCVCDCGSSIVVSRRSLAAGLTRSCWCLRREAAVKTGKKTATHGQTDTPTWRSWKAMLDRCTYTTNISWKNYGGRGITVCDRWRSFANFLADMGPRPPGTTLDRRDNDGDYKKGNCRWATPREQRVNQRSAPNQQKAIRADWQIAR